MDNEAILRAYLQSVAPSINRDRLYRRRGNKGSTIDAERRIAIAREEERLFHFETFTPDDAYALGHYLRKRFQVELSKMPVAPTTTSSSRPPSSLAGSSRGMYSQPNASMSSLGGVSNATSGDRYTDRSTIIISVMTLQEVPLYAGTVGTDGDVAGPRGWGLLEAVSRAVRRTGHSSYYLKAALDSSRETMGTMGLDRPYRTPPHMLGGVFPVYANGNTSEPVATIGVYGGSFTEDHEFIVGALRRFHQNHINASKENVAPPAEQSARPQKKLRTVRSVTFSVDTNNIE